MKPLSLSALALAASLQTAHADDQQAAGQQPPPPPVAMPTDQQNAGSDTTEDAKVQSHDSVLLTSLNGQVLQSLSKLFSAQLNSDDQTATISRKFDISGLFGANPHTDYLTVTAQTPLSQQSDFVNLASLDGLVKSSSVQFRLSVLGDNFKRLSAADKQGNKPVGFLWNFSLDGKVGSQDHDYFDPTTLVQHTATTTPWQVGGSFAGIIFDGHGSVALSFDYQEFHQDGDTGEQRTQCLTVDNCVTGFIGAPVLKHQGLISGDLRWIDELDGHPLGAELKVTYDPIQDAESVQVPVYLTTNSDGALTGGVRFNWNSTDHVSTVGVFAATAFNLGG